MPTFVLLAGLAAEVYFLTHDLSPSRKPASMSVSQAPPIGELVSRQNAVKIQNEGEIVWEDSQGGQTLYRRQSILTLDNSKAEIAFLDGTGLMVDEKSLILLEKTPSDDSLGYQRIVVKLLHGTIHKAGPRKSSDLLRRLGGKTPEIEVQTGDARIELTPASELTIASNPEDPQGTRVIVQSGEVKIESPHGSLTVKPGEEASVPKAGSSAAPSSHKMPFTLLSPKAGQTIQAFGGTQPVRFRWNATREAASGSLQEIEVSADPEFRTGVLRTRIPAAEPPLEYVEINMPLQARSEAALWHWRVRSIPLSGAPSLSQTESFWLKPQTVPALRYPADHAQALAGRPVDFSWEPFESATGYELEITGQAPAATQDSYLRIDRIAPGTTSWRVRAQLKDGSTSGWSPSREIVITDPSAPPPVPSPVPVDTTPPPPPDELDEPEIRPAKPAPQQHSRLERVWQWLITSAYAEDADGWIVHLKWHEVKGVKKYKIQVSRDSSFKHVITEGDASGPEWDWSFKLGMQNSKGRAFFRVASVSDSGVAGAFSKPKPITIPKSILTSVKYSKGTKGVVQEKYAATDGADDAQPTDAADQGDLDTLTAAPPKTVLSKDLSGPKVGPSAQSLRSKPLPVAGLREGEKGVSSNPKDLTAPAAKPSLNKTLPLARSEAAASNSVWHLEASLSTGIGNLTQSSGASDLTSVTPQSPYLQQKINVTAELDRVAGHERDTWLGELQAAFAGFHAPDSPANPAQADFKAMAFRVDVLRNWEKSASSWNLFWGGNLDRSYRWIKTGNLTVDSQGALSLGPSARAVRFYHYSGPALSVREAGAALDLPLTGLLTGGQAGLEGRIWGEWNLAAFMENSMSLGLRAEAEAAYLRWSSPSSTGTLAWTFWVAPAFRF